MRHRLLTRLIATAAGLGLLAAPAAAQQQTDIIRGRVTGPDTLPIPGARITATSYQGNITKSATTDRNGRFQIIFVNGEGDYWLEVAKVGYNRRRFEIKKVGDEQVMLADARLTSAIVSLDAVNITGDNRALVNRNSRGADVSGGDKPLTSTSALLPPDQAGNLAAMASTIPGIQLIPGMDGGADMFSALGLSGDQNSTTFNGLGSGVSTLPPDAQVRITFSQFPADPARGGFSGAQINVASIPGSNFSFRGLSGYGTGPDLEWTDQGADSSGQKSTTLRFGGNLRGPIQMDKAFYNASYSAQRTFADMLTLLNTSPLGLQSAGVAADSAARLLGILQNKQIPVSVANTPSIRATDNLNYQANVDFTPSSSGTGNSLTLGVFGGHFHVQPTGGGVQMLTRTPAQTGEADGWSTSASLLHSNYFWFGVLSQTTLGLRGPAPIPGALSRLSHRLGSRRVAPARWHDLDQGPFVWRRCAGERRGESVVADHQPAPVVQRQQQAHRQGHVESLARAQHVGRERIAGIVLFQFARRPRSRCARGVHAHPLVDSFPERSAYGWSVGR